MLLYIIHLMNNYVAREMRKEKMKNIKKFYELVGNRIIQLEIKFVASASTRR